VPSHSPTTEELLKHAEDLMRQDWAYLKDFNAALEQLQKNQEKFAEEIHLWPSGDFSGIA